MDFLNIMSITVPMTLFLVVLLFFGFYFPFAGYQLTVVVRRSFVDMTNSLYLTMCEILRADGIDPSSRQQFEHDWRQLGMGISDLSKVEKLAQEQLDFYSIWLQRVPYSVGHMKISAEIHRFVTWYNSWKDFMYQGRLMPYIRPLYFWYDWPSDGKGLIFPTK
ncbi:MAG: hypothetical protein UZ21_OP11001000777 [Microgenomates bacterium OLB22]|nr:MAG: hypothetical protein UZ21_OP11001000777 [Microgenomates bacterium OLB22]